ncbi:hypothetical protein DFH27DRAFT_591178 [Peziza echinospora]|nr:hypothetical protein DFH27DRAFT_591178 [Peziza echinospora]
MKFTNGLGRLLLFLSILAPLTAAVPPPSSDLTQRAAADAEAPVKAGPQGPVPTKHPSPGTKDAPVDGRDGKPHTGPMISKDGPPSGSGQGVPPEKGISGGVPSVDKKKPPPITGEHEIVDIEGKDGVGKDHIQSNLDPDSNLSKSVTTDPSDKKNEKDEHAEHGHDGKDSHKNHDDDETRGPPVVIHKDEAEEVVDPNSIVSPMHSFTLSFVMILFSEVGDKTFLIAALMAMKHSRLLVFSAALSSLIVMSILSAVLGHAVPTLLPKKFTSFLAAGLFLVFGVRMIKEGLAMEKGTGGVQEEMKEVENELQEKEAARKRGRSGSDLRNLEEGEWGDRSQIATIAMAAGQDYWWVTMGTVCGHSVCTAGAVIGGKYLAEKISVRNVTLGGAAAFLVFGVIYLIDALHT